MVKARVSIFDEPIYTNTTQAETLGREDAWFCQACNRKQEVVKRMGLWSVPDVLVVHLKRFRHSR